MIEKVPNPLAGKRGKTPEEIAQEPTPLVQIERFCQDFGNSNLWVKDEGARGSWKQRKALYVAHEVAERGVTKVVVITAGNAGSALAEQLKPQGVPVVAIVDPNMSSDIKHKLANTCYKLIEQDLTHRLEREQVIALAREKPDEVIWDVTEGCEASYEPIIDEVVAQCHGVDPEYIFCPFGQGEAYAGLAQGVQKRGMDSVIVCVRPNGRSALADKLDTSILPAYAKTYLNGQMEHGDMIIVVNDADIREAYEYAKQYIRCEPSSAIVFARPVREHFFYTRFNEDRNPPRPSVIINSGGE